MPRRSRWSRDALEETASAQRGLITAAQLAALRVPRSTVSYRNGVGGMFTLLLPGVHLVGGGEPTPDQRDLAALFYSGPRAALTGPSALRRYGVRAVDRSTILPRDRVHVLVPASRQRASHAFAFVERTHHFPSDVGVRDDYPVVAVPRAVLDAARRLRHRGTVRALVAEVVQRNLTDVPALEVELARAQRRGSGFVRAAIAEAAGGTRSVPEGDLRLAFLRRRLAEPLWNPDIFLPNGEFLASPDAYFTAAGVAVEVDSKEYHLSPADWDRTMRRHARMTAVGIAVLHMPPSRISHEIDVVLREILQAVAVGSQRPTPDVRVVPRRN